MTGARCTHANPDGAKFCTECGVALGPRGAKSSAEIQATAQMALFGAPIAHEDHTRRACDAAPRPLLGEGA